MIIEKAEKMVDRMMDWRRLRESLKELSVGRISRAPVKSAPIIFSEIMVVIEVRKRKRVLIARLLKYLALEVCSSKEMKRSCL